MEVSLNFSEVLLELSTWTKLPSLSVVLGRRKVKVVTTEAKKRLDQENGVLRALCPTHLTRNVEPPSSPAGRASCAPRLVLAGSGSCAGTGCSATGWAAGCPTGRVAAGCCPGVFATPCLSPVEETSPKDESAQPTELKLPREDRGEESVSGRGSLFLSGFTTYIGFGLITRFQFIKLQPNRTELVLWFLNQFDHFFCLVFSVNCFFVSTV